MVSALTQSAQGLPRRTVDADLIPRSIAGEQAASHALHEHYYPIASAFLRKLGARPEELEDVLQEVFMQFFRHLASFRGDAQLGTWLFRVCVTEAGRARRRRKVREIVGSMLMREARPQATLPAENSDAAMVEDALARMSEELRATFVLFEMEGVPGKEIAAILRCPEPTVWRRLHAARRIFREALGADAPRLEGKP
jgi:RNA polymerase sigma-70 factor, ECF subfamily